MDQIEFEQDIKDCTSERMIFEKGNHVCQLYDKGLINKQVLEESMDLVRERLRAIAILKNQMNSKSLQPDNRVEVTIVE